MRKRFLLFTFLCLALLSSHGFAWFNDTTSNDTCLTIESDKETYRPDSAGNIYVEYKIANECGKEITANMGEFVEAKHAATVKTEKKEQATAFTNKMDTNGETTIISKTPVFSTIKPAESTIGIKQFTDKMGFTTTKGYQNITIPEGDTFLKTKMNVPFEDGEWAITLIDTTDSKIFSTLDPKYTGAGTAADPYIITDCIDLQDMNAHVNENEVWFELGNDIDCSMSETWTHATGTGFDPIGTDAAPFKGRLDGKSHIIHNLFIDIDDAADGCLFPYLLDANIINLGLVDFNIYNEKDHASTLACVAAGTDIHNVYVSGSRIATGGSWYAAGLVGFVQESAALDTNITNVYVVNSTITSSSAGRMGGIVGLMEPSGSTSANITAAYSNAFVNGTSAEGGAVGLITAGSCGSVYWDTQTSGQATSACGTGLTTANMWKQASYDANWNFTNVWMAHEDTNYPTLREQTTPSTGLDVNIVSIDGNSFFAELPIFSSVATPTVTIDFNVLEEENRRLTIDLNYSLYQTEGTGYVIQNDLNLDLTYCLDLNFSDGNTTCSVDWSLSGVPDGNYFILAKITSSVNSDFNASVRSIGINTGLDLNVLIPINEETNLPISMAAYYFNVKVFDGNVLTIYINNSDSNAFPIRTGIDVVVDIDTNVASVFYGRQYWFNYPATQTAATLQPYLVPVASGILTTIKAQRFENLTAISGIRVKVFKFLSSGRTIVHDNETDFKGEIAIPFVIADAYELEIYEDDVLISTQPYTATSTTSSYYIFISSTGTVEIPTAKPPPKVVFTPSNEIVLSTDVNIVFAITSEYYEMSSMTYFVQNNDTNLFSVTDSAIPTDANTYTIILRHWIASVDQNYPISVNIIVRVSDGNEYIYRKSYTVVTDPNNPIYILTVSSRTLFDCPTDRNQPCGTLMFIAFFFIFLVMAALSAGMGANGTGLAIMALVLTAFFVFISWIVMWVGVFMTLACLGVIITRERFG